MMSSTNDSLPIENNDTDEDIASPTIINTTNTSKKKSSKKIKNK